MDDNRSIDFIEFFSGLDKLRIKISETDAMRCFEYLNSKKDGLIDYNQFCQLTEERRRGIDPFSKQGGLGHSQTPVVERGSQRELGTHDDEVQRDFVKAMMTDDLDQMLKLQEKLGISKRKFQLSKLHTKKGTTILGAPISASPLIKAPKLPIYFDSSQVSMNNILTQDYLKEDLEDRVRQNALNQVSSNIVRPTEIYS